MCHQSIAAPNAAFVDLDKPGLRILLRHIPYSGRVLRERCCTLDLSDKTHVARFFLTGRCAGGRRYVDQHGFRVGAPTPGQPDAAESSRNNQE